MNLSLDLELNDEPEIEIEHREPLIIEISHSIFQKTFGKNNYFSLFILLLIVFIIAIIIVCSNTTWSKNIQFLFFLQYVLGVFSIHHYLVNQI